MKADTQSAQHMEKGSVKHMQHAALALRCVRSFGAGCIQEKWIGLKWMEEVSANSPKWTAT